MGVLVDTNILLRSVEPLHPQHRAAVDAVYRLLAETKPVYFTLQNMAEFWNVATRPIENNGLGFSIPFTLRELEKIEQLLTLSRIRQQSMLSGKGSSLNTVFRE